ncbi:Non-selective Cation Channel-2 (NSCC2) Family [Thraustotheca clavata]|uniref:Non-selective Cation Channel-2 (NSCC2) Family n=1 Tax=Thraustotheca clavata TaxID=74557 RepID=A0A1V9ZUU1_9STRA|nr:Non-selective Cation Channel-2 (NSCC2) Family [Thraustotheca clavata]
MRVSVNVKRSTGDKFTVEADLEGTVLAFKEVLEPLTQVSPSLQRLIYKGKVLKDELTLASYEVEANQTIYFVKGSAKTSATPAAPAQVAPATPAPPAAPAAPAQPVNPFGGNAFGANPFESNASGASPFGANAFGGNGNPYGGMAGMPGMQEMLQNPEMMQQMMQSPMVQSLLNNPEIMRNMMQSNPAMRQLLEQHPELNHVMNDPEMLRRSMEAMSNPAAMREMMRSQDTALRNIESHPEGFNALRRMYTEVQEPLMDAASSGSSLPGTAFPMPGAVGGPAATPQTTTPAAPTPPANPANPWAISTQTPAANPWGANPFGANPLGGAGGIDMNMLNDPMVRGMMDQMSNNPELMRSMMEMNPQFQALDPQMRERLLNPEMLRTMMNPANLQAMMQMQTAMQQLQGSGALPNLGFPPANTGANNPFMNNLFTGGFGGTSAAAVENPEEHYASQLVQLNDMGFTNRDQNIQALRRAGDQMPPQVDAAMDSFLNEKLYTNNEAVAVEEPELLELQATQDIADRMRQEIKSRQAIEMERRVEYFRGKELRRCFPSATAEEIMSYGQSLLYHEFIHRSERLTQQNTKRIKSSTKMLTIAKQQYFTHDGYYTWMYEGSTTLRNTITAAFVALAAICTMYPLWPASAQSMLWKSAVTIALVGFSIAFVRFNLWLCFWLTTGRHVWLFPNFPIPSPCIETTPKRHGPLQYRAIVCLFLASLALYFYMNPLSFGKRGAFHFCKQLIREAYKGTVFNRFSQQEKDIIYTLFLRPRQRFLYGTLALICEFALYEMGADCCNHGHGHGHGSISSVPAAPLSKEEEEEFKSVKKMADYLRGRNGMPVRQAIEMGKRVEFFRGDKLGKFLMNNEGASKYCPGPVTTKEEALAMGSLLVTHGFIHRSERDAKNKKLLQPSQSHEFTTDGFYTWMYDGPKTLRNFLTAALIIGFTGLVCYPIWPQWSKVCVWYMSVTFLIVIIVFCIVRLIAFFFLWLAGIEFWFLPNIFDDNLGVIDSFKPLYSLRKTDPSETKYRLIGLIAFIAFCVWVAQQPTDFDEYMALTKQFTDDVYSGKLLDDMSQKDKEDIDKVKVPDLEDLMRDEATDIFSEKDEESNFDSYMEQKYFSEDATEDDYFPEEDCLNRVQDILSLKMLY